MTSIASPPRLRPVQPKPQLGRREVARRRIAKARAAISDCRLCAHRCGVNRVEGERGICRAGSSGKVFSAQVEVSDELELIPCFAIGFSGCDLRCDFCITGAESWNPSAGEGFGMDVIAQRASDALERGARSIMILGGEPTIHLLSVVQLVSHLPDSATLVWKTNAHATAEARDLLDGLFEVWLPDYKFGNDACALRLAKVENYTRVVQENLLWARGRVDLIVRHLLMPGHLECCWEPAARWLAANLPDVRVNLRAGFWPAWHAHRHTELSGPPAAVEETRALDIANRLSLRLIQ